MLNGISLKAVVLHVRDVSFDYAEFSLLGSDTVWCGRNSSILRRIVLSRTSRQKKKKEAEISTERSLNINQSSWRHPKDDGTFRSDVYSRVSFYDGVTFSNIWL